MLRRLVIALGSSLAAYVVGAVLGGVLVTSFSPNTHDRELEAAMTGAFATGPVAALIGFGVGFARAKRAR